MKSKGNTTSKVSPAIRFKLFNGLRTLVQTVRKAHTDIENAFHCYQV